MNKEYNIALNGTPTKGFGYYFITHLPPEDKYPFTDETLDEMWEVYRTENENLFTNIIHVTSELSDLNFSEEFFRDAPQLHHVFDYWKDKLLLQELPVLLSPEKLISWESFEVATLDMFHDMLEAELGTNEDVLDDYDPSVADMDKDLDILGSLMHIVSPFMFLMLRYSYYNTWLQKTISDDDFRRKRATANFRDNRNGLRLVEIHDVNTGGVTSKRIYRSLAMLFAQALKGYIETTPQAMDADSIDVQSYISMAQMEVSRLGQDERFLREHCQPFFADSLIEWHRGYFAYLIRQIHQFKGYENYQIPEYRVKEVKKKPKIIDENRALTSLGKSCRRAIVKYIQECQMVSDYGRLLYMFQFEKKFFTLNLLSRNEYYIFMQQIGKVTFCPSGDFSNCNKGFNRAAKEAQERRRLLNPDAS